MASSIPLYPAEIQGNGQLENSTPVALHWQNVSYTVKTLDKKGNVANQKEILHSVSGKALPGEFVAVMGPSGSGKTSLLNILAKKRTSGEVSGQIMANGQSIYDVPYASYISYVTQNDVLLDTMTIRESIEFSVNLRTNLSISAKQERVNALIKELKLEDSQNTLIGSNFVKGCSGGEKKRAAIAVQMVNNPSVLFLDEPTSGLDSYTSQQVITLLGQLAKTGRTVISVIHQPNSEMFYGFDKLILIGDGNILYQGDSIYSLQHFDRIGLPCNPQENPADHYMELLHVHNRLEWTQEEQEVYEKMKQGYGAHLAQSANDRVDIDRYEKLSERSSLTVTSSAYQFKLCYRRALKDMLRNPKAMKAKFVGLLLTILYTLLIVHDLGKNYESYLNRIGLLFLTAVNLVLMQNLALVTSCKLYLVPLQKAVFLKEYGDNMYGVGPFLFSKFLVHLFDEILSALIYSLFIYWIAGLNTDSADKWFIFCKLYTDALCLISFMIGTGLGLLIGTIFSEPAVAVNMGGVIFIQLITFPLSYFCGYLRNLNNIPDGTAWIQWISPFKYSFAAYAFNEFDNLNLDCDNDFTQINCYHPTDKLHLSLDLGGNIGVMVAFLVGFRLLAYWSLNSKAKNSIRQ